jgi:glycosyltransferase involved in cell wall biosynthesis
MRVLFVNHGALIGGAETNLLNILRFCDRGGFEPVGLLLPGKGPLASQVHNLGIDVGEINYYGLSWLNPIRYGSTLFQLVSWIRRTRPSIIHLNHQWLVSHIVQAGIVTGTPVVCHTRNYLDERFVDMQRRWLHKSQALIVESQAVLMRACALGLPPERIHLVHNGIDPKRFSADALSNSQEPNAKWRSGSHNGPLIGFSGRIVPEKGPEDLIHAIPQVLQYWPTARFLFLGSDQQQGAYLQRLQRLSEELGIQRQVEFLGFQNNPENWLMRFDVLVIPSRSTMPEGLPLTALEGLAAGCLVVATPNSGIPELIREGETGFLVKFDDAQALANGIVTALNLSQNEASKLRSAGRNLIEEKFSIAGQVAKLGQIFKTLTAEKSRYID